MSDLFTRIEQLKRDRNAVFLAHYYQDPDIKINEELCLKALKPIERMLALS